MKSLFWTVLAILLVQQLSQMEVLYVLLLTALVWLQLLRGHSDQFLLHNRCLQCDDVIKCTLGTITRG